MPPRSQSPPPSKVETARSQITIPLHPAIETALRVVGCDKREYRVAISRAKRLDNICDRYVALVAKFTPTLSEVYWCGLMDMLDLGLSSEEFAELRAQPHALSRYVRAAHIYGVRDKWDYDRQAFEQEVAELPDTAFIAVVEIADRYWSSDMNDGRSRWQRLKDCGARIA